MRWEGTTFEKGIDNQTKLDNLLEGNFKLKKMNRSEKKSLIMRLNVISEKISRIE